MEGVPLPQDPVLGGGWRAILERLETLRSERGVTRVVLGLPLTAGGRPTELSDEVGSLSEAIAAAGFEVVTIPEAGTTAEASGLPGRRSRSSGRTDSLAALIILERYLACH